MVSSLSSRLLAGRGDGASLGSGKSNGSPQQNKRSVTGSLKGSKNENLSGYSADREGPSAAYPPVVSINLHSKSKSSTRRVDELNCPKRQKKNQMQFAATTVKADLARAGKEYKLLGKDLEQSKILGDSSIKLKDHVRLLNSSDISGSLVPTSNIVRQTTITDYAALVSSVSAFYPCKPTQMSDMKPFERALPTGEKAWSEPSATSSVSDTLSDSGSDNTTNNQSSHLSPLLEDSLFNKNKSRKKSSKTVTNTSENVTSFPNAVTMTKILQLSKTARYDHLFAPYACPKSKYFIKTHNFPFVFLRIVTKSFAPYSIIHANAAFHRLSGKKGNERVIGKSFFSLLDPESNPSQDKMSLSSFMISSDKGEDSKLNLLPIIPGESASNEKNEPVKCTVRVSPVLDLKIEEQAPAKLGYFAVEFVLDGNKFDETSLTNTSELPLLKKAPVGVIA